jgi:hypothetical protein
MIKPLALKSLISVLEIPKSVGPALMGQVTNHNRGLDITPLPKTLKNQEHGSVFLNNFQLLHS